MVFVGIEGIRYFDKIRKVYQSPDDSKYAYTITNGFYEKLLKIGHRIYFYLDGDKSCERQIRSQLFTGEKGLNPGDDFNWVDNVDLFFICTHGTNYGGRPSLKYNLEKDSFRAFGEHWRLGDGTFHHGLSTLMLCACDTTELDRPLACWDIFQGLKEICCSYGGIYDYFGTDEIGRDVAQNLIDGDTIADAWLDGVSDGWVDDHPIVIGANDRRSHDDKGNFIKEFSTLNLDCLQPHGYTVTLGKKVSTNRIWMEKGL